MEPSGELTSISRMTTHIVAACARRPWLVILVAAALGASAFWYNVGHVAIDTDSAKLIGEELSWRKRERVFDAAFPQRADLIAVVVDGATPELAEEATKTLARRLSSQPGMYRAVWRPDGGPFFERAGLLFESTAEVSRTTAQLIAAQPLLGTLAADPTLRGLMDALSLMLEGMEHDPARVDELAQPLASLADAIEAVVAGQTPAFSWRTLFTGSVPAPRELRRFILVQPVLDYSALRPGERASTAIRLAALELGQDVDPRIRIRLTGPVPLADEEFGTLAEGALVNASAMMLAIVVLLWIALRSLRLVAAILLSLCRTLCRAWRRLLHPIQRLLSRQTLRKGRPVARTARRRRRSWRRIGACRCFDRCRLLRLLSDRVPWRVRAGCDRRHRHDRRVRCQHHLAAGAHRAVACPR
jgi:hypothetical protein